MRRVAALTAVLGVLAGCASAPAERPFAEVDHVHSVATDGEQVFAGTHQGVYAWDGQTWSRVGDEFDVMGMALGNGVIYASGHPGPRQDLPDPLGVLVSDDGGDTWDSHSLLGEVDFHLLRVGGRSLVGVAANYSSVVYSGDDGATWTPLDISSLTDLGLSPDGATLAVVSEGTVLVSGDGGARFSEHAAPANAVKIDWWGDTVAVATPAQLYIVDDMTGDYTALPHIFSGISDIALSGSTVVVMDVAGVHLSRDSGATFSIIG